MLLPQEVRENHCQRTSPRALCFGGRKLRGAECNTFFHPLCETQCDVSGYDITDYGINPILRWRGRHYVDLRTYCVRLTTLYFCSLWTPLLNVPARVSPIGVSVPFRIYKVQGDGNVHFVVAVQTLDDAKARVRELGETWPG